MIPKPESLWSDTVEPVKFSPLEGSVDVDVLVVGGGITGITTAYLLKRSGSRVAVVDQQAIGGGETAHTTAHVTFVTDTRLSELADTVGEDAARALWEAGRLAMRQIEEITAALGVDAELHQVPGYLFAADETEKEVAALKRDAELALKLGFDAEFVSFDPVFGQPAVRFPNQLKFHPLRYLQAAANAIPGAGSHVFAETCGSNIDPERHELRTEKGTIHYDALVAATHVPIQGERGALGAALFQTKLAAYSSYAIGAEIETPVAEALFWDTRDPYYYWRFEPGEAGKGFVIFGGEDHKTGQETDTEACYERLARVLRERFPAARPSHRWSGQVIETPDGLPFIGEIGKRQFLATGYAGNGMTLGTFAGMMLRDLIGGRSNPWTDLFEPGRKRLAGTWDYLRENKDFPAYFVRDHLRPAESMDAVERGGGGIVRLRGKKCAVHCDAHGERTVLSATCPHLGCIVAWNAAEKTWDCPCHGSRFTATGELIAGPAESSLAPVES